MKPEDDYLFDKTGDPDPDVVRLENALAPLRYTKKKQRPPRRIWPALALAAGVLIFFYLRSTKPHEDALAVTRIDGSPRIASRTVHGRDALDVGAWLETDGTSRADIELAKIGHVEVRPGSRLKLANVSPSEQRLELERGAIEAKVIAPPRLFVVDTPSGRATDLGCEYRLEIVPAGGSLLHVKRGAVELAGNGREAWVPATAACETRAGRGPGCPWFEDASPALVAAIHRIDFETPLADDLATVLDNARARDTLTLWHLGGRAAGADRARIFGRIRELAQGTWSNEPALSDLVSHW